MKLPMQVDLTGKVAVVTGAGGVICSVMAEALAASGAKVALLDLNEEAAAKSAAAITEKGFTAKGTNVTYLRKQASRQQEMPSQQISEHAISL